jgi:alpha-amylase
LRENQSQVIRFPLVLLLLIVSAAAQTNFYQPSPRSAYQGDVLYFLLPDRFQNGDPSNDRGAIDSEDPLITGFDPHRIHFYHGGDLSGVVRKLDYIRDLGATLIWMTPFLKNKTVQTYGGLEKSFAGYHGYWILDFTEIDPHLGTKSELQTLISEARKRGIGTVMDLVVNHTADVIQPGNGSIQYQYKFSKPYLDSDGKPFDDRDYINKPNFPKLDPDKSFPVPPSFANDADRTVKKPDWLNDVTVYHNRGNIISGGESTQYGDLSGLDDLFTEQRRVLEGMTQIYQHWIQEFDLQGFRLDTVKHVNNEFWQAFVPAMFATAQAVGRKNFFVIGEVYDPDPAVLSEYVHRAAIPTVLDFGFQKACVDFVTRQDSPAKLVEFFQKDDFYTTRTTNAYQLVTFTGNHDIGRVGYFLRRNLPDAKDEELIARDILAHALLMFSRGIPIIYYGDEQGFAGKGGDAASRQDMFASRTAEYAGELHLGGGTGADDSFNEKHRLFRAIEALIAVRRKYPALQSGIQIIRLSETRPGLFAFSRIDPQSKEEMLVVLNNATEPHEGKIPISSVPGGWEQVYATTEKALQVASGPGDHLTVTLPGLSALVLRNPQPLQSSEKTLDPLILSAARGSDLDGRWELKVETNEARPLSVAFGVRAKEETDFRWLGSDDAPPYRLYPTWDELPTATELEFKVIARDLFGHETAAEVTWKRRQPRNEH